MPETSDPPSCGNIPSWAELLCAALDAADTDPRRAVLVSRFALLIAEVDHETDLATLRASGRIPDVARW